MTLDEIVALDMKAISDQSDEELRKILSSITEQLYTLRFRKVTDVVENPAIVRNVRRAYARISTFLRQKENRPRRRRIPRAKRVRRSPTAAAKA